MKLSLSDGGILDPDDRVCDVLDDKEQVSEFLIFHLENFLWTCFISCFIFQFHEPVFYEPVLLVVLNFTNLFYYEPFYEPVLNFTLLILLPDDEFRDDSANLEQYS